LIIYILLVSSLRELLRGVAAGVPLTKGTRVVGLKGRLASLVGGVLVIGCLAIVGPGAVASAQGTIVSAVTVTPTPNPATTGAVNYAVTVSDTTQLGTPTGSVAVSDGASGTCNINSLTPGPADYTSSGSCSIEEPAGDYTNVTATYSGDSNYAGAVGTASETVDAATPTVTVTQQSDAVTGLVSYNVSVAGPAGAVIPTGSVSVSDGVNPSCSIPSLNAGSGSCSIEEDAVDGPYDVTATFTTGDSNYLDAVGSASGQTVGAATPSVGVSPQTDPPATTGPVSYTVAVAGPVGAVVPTGSVSVSDGVNPPCSITLAPGTGSQAGSAVGSCSIQEVPGSYNITATLTSGDANYTGAVGTAFETVGEGLPTVSVTPPPGNAKTGLQLYAVSVAGPSGAPTPTGSVVVSDNSGTPYDSCTFSLDNGSGSCSIAEGAGTWAITATFTSGDTNYLGATGSASLTVAKALAQLTPSLTASTVYAGNVTYSISVAGTTASIVPSGTVVVDDLHPYNPSAINSCQIQLEPGTGAQTGDGVGSCSFVQPAQGAGTAYHVQFTYSGDTNYSAPTPAPYLSQFVIVAPVNVSVTPNANPASAGKSSGTAKVTYTVTVTAVTPSGLGAPTAGGGGVIVSDGTGNTCSITRLAAGVNPGSSVGHCDIVEPFAANGYSVSAEYYGDDNYQETTGLLTEYVGSKTKTAYSQTGSPGTPGGANPVVLTATVTSFVPGSGPPSGNVEFTVDGATPVSVGLDDGVATLDYYVPADTPKGTETVLAQFQSSDTNTWFNSQKNGSFKVN
jgi:hypothetical protein